MARVMSSEFVWERWTTVIDEDNKVVRLESPGQTDEEWTGVEIERRTQSEWAVQHPELGTITINVQRGCACTGTHIKSRTNGRPVR